MVNFFIRDLKSSNSKFIDDGFLLEEKISRQFDERQSFMRLKIPTSQSLFDAIKSISSRHIRSSPSNESIKPVPCLIASEIGM